MASPAIILRHLCFTGPNKKPALLEFFEGLNVVYGASETGKSFVLEAIDFMLGASGELRDIKERIGYDRIFLGIQINAKEFTFARSTSGGNYLLFQGLHESLPSDPHIAELSPKHNVTNDRNISNFLLTKIGLNGRVVKTKANGDTRNLSFRDLSHLALIDEIRIQNSSSPIEPSGQYTNKTAEYSIFKLLLTGVDDSSIIASSENISVSQGSNSKIELIDELISACLHRLPEDSPAEEELKEQLEKLENSIAFGQPELNELEHSYRETILSRNKILDQLEQNNVRLGEIEELKARFQLLNGHYTSDLKRLEGIREAGSLLIALEIKSCPLCGALPDHQHPDQDSFGNIELLVTASNAESQKIKRLQSELIETLNQLDMEVLGFNKNIPLLRKKELNLANKAIEIQLKLSDQKVEFTSLVQKRSSVQSILGLFNQIKELQERKELLMAPSAEENTPIPPSKETKTDLSTIVLDQFAQQVQSVLKAWNFPDSDRVQFDTPTKDLLISGKKRGSHGKGMRSITHVAFITSLLEFCQNKNLVHPGFLVVDSPLLAYREPEDSADDLSHTDVQDKFYEYFSSWSGKQIIVIENETPPNAIVRMSTTHFFSKNEVVGRYGLFPVEH